MPYSSLLSEVRGKFEGIISLIEFLDQKFQEHGKDWAEDVDYKDFDFKKIAEQIQNQAKTKYWYVPLSCNYLSLLIYSILEDTLNNICKTYENLYNPKIKFKDYPGKGIERATKYLAKVGCLSKIRDDRYWGKIDSWAVIRNTIAHANGRISEIKEKDKNKILKTVNIDNDEINLTFSDVKEFYNISKSYLEYVFERLKTI